MLPDWQHVQYSMGTGKSKGKYKTDKGFGRIVYCFSYFSVLKFYSVSR